MRVLAVNAGSSTLKLRLIGPDDRLEASLDIDPWDGSVEPVGLAGWLGDLRGVDAIGHRVVHGGDRYREAVRIRGDVLDGIAELTHLAPLHQPRALAAVEAVRAVGPDVPGVARFDTAFHADLPAAAATYAPAGPATCATSSPGSPGRAGPASVTSSARPSAIRAFWPFRWHGSTSAGHLGLVQRAAAAAERSITAVSTSCRSLSSIVVQPREAHPRRRAVPAKTFVPRSGSHDGLASVTG